MKNFYLLFLLITGMAVTTLGQSTRMVLIEEATNASCGPCASQNPDSVNTFTQKLSIVQ
jgi:hypothetical protein